MRRLTALTLAAALAVTAAPTTAPAKQKELPPQYDTTAVAPVACDWHESAVKLLVDKKEIYPDVIEMCEMAEHEILLNMYLFGGDDNTYAEPEGYIGIGKHVIDIMARKMREAQEQDRPFRARLITPKPSEMIDKQKKIFDTIRRVRERLRGLLHMEPLPPPVEPGYEPIFDYAEQQGIPILASNTDAMYCEQGASWRLDHNKLLVIDGKEALIGGMNFAECVSSNHDAMTRITGSVVHECKAVFANAWHYAVLQATRDGGTVPEEYLDVDSLVEADDAVINAHHLKRVGEGWELGNLRMTLTAPYVRNTRQPCLDLLASVGPGDQVMMEMLLLTDEPCIQALVEAHQRGAEVRVILDPNHSLYGVNCMGAPNILAVKPFLEVGLPIRNFTPKDSGQELHMKLVIGKRANGETEFAMGSTNWTYGAFESNYEQFTFYKNMPKICQRLVATFEDDWANHTHLPGREITTSGFLGLKKLSEDERYRELNKLQKFIHAFLEERHEKWF